jgi:hypothetical protein
LFINRVRNYVKTFEEKRLHQMLGKGFKGLRILQFNPDLDQVLWEIHQIKIVPSRDFKFDLLTGVSSMFFYDRHSILYYFDQEGGDLPENEYKAIGDGEAYASYYLKRYYEDNITMKKFASLGDFIIRYFDNEKYRLADSVGLEAKFPYPQIKYIPDNPEDCKPYTVHTYMAAALQRRICGTDNFLGSLHAAKNRRSNFCFPGLSIFRFAYYAGLR